MSELIPHLKALRYIGVSRGEIAANVRKDTGAAVTRELVRQWYARMACVSIAYYPSLRTFTRSAVADATEEISRTLKREPHQRHDPRFVRRYQRVYRALELTFGYAWVPWIGMPPGGGRSL